MAATRIVWVSVTGDTVDGHVGDLRAPRLRSCCTCSVKFAEGCRILVNGWLFGSAGELLLQDRLELGAGERDGLHEVVERLHGESLAVGHDAVALAGRASWRR